MRFATWIYSLAALVIAAALLITLPVAPAVGPDGCDNLMGECLRARQEWAMRGITSLTVALAVGCIAATLLLVRSRRLNPALVGVLVLATLTLAFNVTMDPMEHLNDRWRGWLHA